MTAVRLGINRYKLILAIVAAVAISPNIALANGNLATPTRTIIVPQHDAPATIVGCAAIADDFINNRVDPPAYAYTQVHTEVAFMVLSMSPKAAATIRFAFEVDDSFNHPYGTFFGTVQGSYAPGITIQPHRAGLLNVLQSDATAWNENVAGQDIGGVACYISDVKFIDGSMWHANIAQELRDDGVAMPPPAPSP